MKQYFQVNKDNYNILKKHWANINFETVKIPAFVVFSLFCIEIEYVIIIIINFSWRLSQEKLIREIFLNAKNSIGGNSCL